MSPDAAAGEGRSARKRRAILAAARDVFLGEGYAGATMDAIAAAAAVSKQTLYKQFGDKERLFGAIVAAEIGDAEAKTEDMVAALGASADVERDLLRFARQHIVDMTQPELLRLRRLIVAEADRFPEFAREWRARGPERAYATLAAQLDELVRRGVLRIDDTRLAAQLLNWLIVSIPVNDAMLLGSQATFGEDELTRYAEEGIRVFLAAYRP